MVSLEQKVLQGRHFINRGIYSTDKRCRMMVSPAWDDTMQISSLRDFRYNPGCQDRWRIIIKFIIDLKTKHKLCTQINN
jgi:hypothetical protein